MTKFEGGTFTVVSTGGDTIILDDSSLIIDEIFFSTESPDDNGSVGFADGTNNYTLNPLYNDSSTSKALQHFKNISSVKTKTLSLTLTDKSNAGEFSINVDTRTENAKVYFLVKGH